MTNTGPQPGVLQRPLIKVNGAALAQDLAAELVDCRVDLGLGRPGQAQLRFNDGEYKVMDATTFAIGNPLSVSFETEQGAATEVFKGTIAMVGVDAGAGAAEPVVTITAYDHAYKIGRSSVQKVGANQKYSDIVRMIATAAGLQSACPATTIVYKYTIQLADDLALLNHICAATGLVWFVADGKLTLVKPEVGATAVVTLTMRESLISFRGTSTVTNTANKVTARSWDPVSKAAVVGIAASEPPKLTTAPAATSGRSKASSDFRGERTTLTRVAASQNEAELAAEALRHASTSDELVVRGEAFGDPRVTVGATIEVKGVGTSLSGRYFLTEVEHVYSRRGFVTRFVSGGLRPMSLVDLLRGGGSLPWHLRGPVIGVVTDIGSENADKGRVKVKFPVVGDNISSNWARVVSVGAGPNRGLMMMPSINDEVLVMFEDGELTRPVVIGGVWNGKDLPPAEVVQENGKIIDWLLKTTQGHTVTIRNEDTDSKPAFELALADRENRLVLSKEKVELMGKGRKPLQIKAGEASITFTDQGDIEIKGGKITMTATKDIEVEGTNVKVTAKAKLNLKGTSGAELAGATIAVKGDSLTEVKGGMVKIN